MNDKIRELSLKIRKEGFEKAQVEVGQLLEGANQEAEAIRLNARLEAEAIVTKAKEAADRHRERVMADLKLSVEQILLVLRKDIVDLLLTKVIDKPLESIMNNTEFVAKLIEDAVRNWKEYDSESDLEILLPSGAYTSMVDQFGEIAHRWLNNGIELNKVTGIGAGFEIQQKNGHYKICMTDEAFILFLKENLRPVARQFLFEKEG